MKKWICWLTCKLLDHNWFYLHEDERWCFRCLKREMRTFRTGKKGLALIKWG